MKIKSTATLSCRALCNIKFPRIIYICKNESGGIYEQGLGKKKNKKQKRSRNICSKRDFHSLDMLLDSDFSIMRHSTEVSRPKQDVPVFRSRVNALIFPFGRIRKRKIPPKKRTYHGNGYGAHFRFADINSVASQQVRNTYDNVYLLRHHQRYPFVTWRDHRSERKEAQANKTRLLKTSLARTNSNDS